jgi:hypothetical protein
MRLAAFNFIGLSKANHHKCLGALLYCYQNILMNRTRVNRSTGLSYGYYQSAILACQLVRG